VKGNGVLHSAESDEWLTPLDLFERLDLKWNFTLDPCGCSGFNLSTSIRWVGKQEDGLRILWKGYTVFCNPPYSAISDWVAKAHASRAICRVVMLIPSRTDTKYWHTYIQNDALKVEFLPGRLQFRDAKTGLPAMGPNKKGKLVKQSAPFPSCLVYF
jgi:site-specific DNA-methyltransferase (adenine-specific)